MLTKEEADMLLKAFDGGTADFEQMLEQLTEKPKREVQVGDIYLDKRGMPAKIIRVIGHEKGYYPYDFLIGSCATDGVSSTGQHVLDLSKRYELVEVENNKIYLVTSREGVETFIHKCFFNKEKAQKYSDMEQEIEDARQLGFLGRFEVKEIELEVE